MIGLGQAEKAYRSIRIDSLKALNGGRVDVKDTLSLDSLAVYGSDLSSQYTSRSLVDSAFVGVAMSGSGDGIYDGSGSLSSNPTIVTQAANKLQFTSTIIDGFSIDGTTFSVDAANNRVGIGTATPPNIFTVDAALNDGITLRNTSSQILAQLARGNDGGVLKLLNATGAAITVLFNTGAASYIIDGNNFGFGTSNPTNSLRFGRAHV